MWWAEVFTDSLYMPVPDCQPAAGIQDVKWGISNIPRLVSPMIRVFPSFEHSAESVRNPQTILGLLCSACLRF